MTCAISVPRIFDHSWLLGGFFRWQNPVLCFDLHIVGAAVEDLMCQGAWNKAQAAGARAFCMAKEFWPSAGPAGSSGSTGTGCASGAAGCGSETTSPSASPRTSMDVA